MIFSRFTENGWLQIVAFSDNATSAPSTLQAKISNKQLKDLIASLEAASVRVYSYEMDHTTPLAQEDYNNGIFIKTGFTFVSVYLTTYSFNLLFGNHSMYISLTNLDSLIASLKKLV